MKRSIYVLTLAILFNLVLFGSQVFGAEFSPALDEQLSQAGGSDVVGAIVILESPIDIQALDNRLHAEKAGRLARQKEVLNALHYNAEMTQPKFVAEFEQGKAAGVIKQYEAFWIENLFVVWATKDVVDSYRSRGDIRYVTEIPATELVDRMPPSTPNVKERDHGGSLDNLTLPVGLRAINAYRVATELGITGQGTLVGNCDTGVDGTHPALQTRWRGYAGAFPWQQCWYDALNSSTTPADAGSHGTHTMGTITGRAISGADTTWTGVAPDARWIASRAIDTGRPLDSLLVDAFRSYQWFADPDGNPNTTDDQPDVVSNSWGVTSGHVGTQCYDYWNTVLTNLEAAGTVVVFAAGNEGTSGLRSPSTYSLNETQIFSVGAVDASAYPTTPYPIASFSSQGPTPCTPAVPNNIKPEISAPGVNVYSSIPGGGYDGAWSGTSMATPHIAGVVALMRQACPNCDPTTIKMALMNTAVETGYVTPPATENNVFGNGFVDAYAAVVAVSNLGRVEGYVRDASNVAISGATVRNAAGAQQVTTDATGFYSLPLSAGTYSVQYSKFGYISTTLANVVVVQNQITTRNVNLTAAPQGTVSGIVTSCYGGPAVGATVSILNTPVSPATTNASGFYTITLPQGTYDMSASGAGCGSQTITGVVIGATLTQNFTLPIDPRFACSAADAGGYVACEDGDQSGPTYVWMEVSPTAGGPGTIATSVVGDDAGQSVALPFSFRIYGQTYTSAWICTNGFVSFSTSSTAYSNSALPTSTLGYAVVPFWDDMNVSTGSDVSYYYYAAQNAFIIEWHAVPHLSGGSPETFQVWLYNVATNPGPNGDSQIRIQYQTVALGTSCTVGVQSGTVANQYSNNGTLDANAQGLANSRVITYGGTTTPTFGILAGTITDCNAVPAANATVSFPGSFYPSITADANGHYTQNMVPGTYDVRGDKLPCTYARINGNVVTANQTTTVNLTLRAPTALQGTVTNCSGGPAAGATVSFPGASPAIADITTDAAGHYYQTVPGGTTYVVGAAKFPCSAVQSPATQVNETQTITVNLTLGAPGSLQGTVTSCTGGPAVGATVSLIGTTIPSVTTNGAGFYQFLSIPAGTYATAIAFAGCWPDSSTGHVVNSGTTTTYNVTLISDPAANCSPADGYGYIACENIDFGGPTFAWRAISPSEGGAGTTVSGLTDDNYAGPFTLPFMVRFFGVDYTTYYVSSNGYVTLGSGYGGIPYACMPMSGFPVGLYVFGDDMYPPAGGEVAYYSDAATHTYVIEYYNIQHYPSGSPEQFEIIIYDPVYYPTATGDADVVFQYNTAASVASNTIGIQQASGTPYYHEYLCNDVRPATTSPLSAGRAVRFGTGPGCVGAPIIGVTPNSFSKSVPLNGSTLDSLYICNTGPCPLNWTAAWVQVSPVLLFSSIEPTASPNMDKDLAMGLQSVVSVDKTRVASDGPRGRNQLDNQGGPDAFGYTWIDSNQPGGPTYNWVEISSVGQNTGITGDDQSLSFALPFNFSFYGNTYASVNVCSNGNLQFGTSPSTAWTNTALPSTSAPMNMIAPFWDDLYLPSGGGNIYYYSDLANNRFIVQYDSMPHISGSTNRYTFEVLLYSDGHIVCQYENLIGDVAQCTVGQQNATGTDGLQVVYNAAYLANGLAIQYAATPPVPQWLSFPAGSAGQVQANQCSWLRLNFNSTGLATGLYTGNIILTNNDVAHNPVTIPVTFQVGQLNPPTQITLFYLAATNELQLRWVSSNAPMYKILSSVNASGPFNTIVGTTTQTTYTFPFPSAQARLHYVVVATDGAFESAPSGPAAAQSMK
jgi:hypothetical protein